MRLKNQLATYLRHYDITAAQLARRSHVSKQVISGWLGGSSPKNVEQIKKVADVLKTTVDHLCFGSGVESPKASPLNQYETEIKAGIFEVVLRRVEK